MKRWICLLGIAALGILPAGAQIKAPQVSFDAPAKDFGKVTAGETLRHVFQFTNRGQAVLEIFQVRPT